jgi:Ser/Thr protein kinase RdoA (MazF antagonist)
MEALYGRQTVAAARRRSTSAARRAERLNEIVGDDGSPAFVGALTQAPADAQPLVRDAVALVRKLAPQELDKSRAWQDVDLPLQYRLGDVHHDHVLFVGDDVTGVVDFGAVDFDAPAGDVARLLGSLVGDDRERRRVALAAYESVRPMRELEREAVAFFDTSGSVVSAAHWLEWLWPRDPKQAPAIADRTAALDRLARLVERLRVLAGG